MTKTIKEINMDTVAPIESKRKGVISLNFPDPKLGVVDGEYKVQMLTHLHNLSQVIRSKTLIVIGVISKDPNSIYFAEQQQTSSTDKRKLSNNTRVEYEFAKSNFTEFGQSQTLEDKLLYVDKFEAGAEVAGMIGNIITSQYPKDGYKAINEMNVEELVEYQNQLGFFQPYFKSGELTVQQVLTSLTKFAVVKEEDIIVKQSFNELDYSFMNPTVKVLPIAFGEVVPASVGKTRQGHAQYLFTMADEARANGFLETMNKVQFMKTLGMKFSAFAKEDDGKFTLGLSKAITRTRLDNSSSLETDLFKGRSLRMTYNKTYQRQVPVLKDNQFTYDAEGNIVYQMEDIEVEILVFDNNMTMMLAPDFTVFQEVTTLVTTFDKDGNLGSQEVTQVIERNATDGAIYMSGRLRKQYFDKAFGKVHGALQFRGFGYQKGLAVFVPNLEYFAGVDILSFEGSRKADVKEYLKGNEELTFSVLNFSREPKVNEISRFARQGMTNVLLKKEMAEDAFTISSEYFNKALEFELDSLKALLGVDEIKLNDLEGYQDMINNLLTSNDSTTTQYLSANPELALKSGSMMDKANTLISSVMKKFKNGHAYLDDSYTRHMLVDPLSILSYMRKGSLGVIKGAIKQIGISEDSSIDIGKNEEGTYYLKDGKCIVVRYPNLDRREVRKLAKNQFEDDKTEALYTRYAQQGYFKGLFLFSLWDMNPEGMSGADFDGDTCLVINTLPIVAKFQPTTLFLDYSLVQDNAGTWEMVDGCPFSTPPTDVNIYDLIPNNKHYLIEKYELTIGKKYGDIKFNKLALENENEFMDLIFPVMQYFILVNLKGNDIGKYTNMLTTVAAVKSEVSADINTARALAKELVDLIPIQTSLEVAEGLAQDALEVQNAIEDLVREYEGYENLQIYLTSTVRWEIDAAKHGGAYRDKLGFLEILDGIQNNDSVVERIIEAENKYGVSLQRMFVSREAVVKPSLEQISYEF